MIDPGPLNKKKNVFSHNSRNECDICEGYMWNFFQIRMIKIAMNDKEYLVQEATMFLSGKYLREFKNQNSIIVDDSFINEYFSSLVDYLENNTKIYNKKTMMGILDLMKKWEIHFLVVEGLKNCINCCDDQSYILHHGKLHAVSKTLLIEASDKFKQVFISDEESVVVIPQSYKPEIVNIFIDFLLKRTYNVDLCNVCQLYELADEFGCVDLKNALEIKNKQIEPLMLLSRFENTNNTGEYEAIISENIDNYLELSEFYDLPIPSIIRIMDSIIENISIESKQIFFKSIIEKKGSIGLVFLQYYKPAGFDELITMLDSFKDNHNCFFGMISQQFEELQNEIESKKSKLIKAKKRIDDLEKERDSLIDRLKKSGLVETKPIFKSTLHYACYINNLEVVRFFLDSGYPIDSPCPQEVENFGFITQNASPIHFACFGGNSDIVKYLIDKKCNINKKNAIFLFFFITAFPFIKQLKLKTLMLLKYY